MKKFPFSGQMDSVDCGPACIGMIAQYFGKRYSLPALARMCGMTAEGASLLGLSRAAEAIGFRTMAIEISLEAIEKEGLLPFIAHWSQRHFLVVYKIKGNRVWVADPARGLLVLGRREFLEQWVENEGSRVWKEEGIGEEGRGIALLLEPTPRFYEMGFTR